MQTAKKQHQGTGENRNEFMHKTFRKKGGSGRAEPPLNLILPIESGMQEAVKFRRVGSGVCIGGEASRIRNITEMPVYISG